MLPLLGFCRYGGHFFFFHILKTFFYSVKEILLFLNELQCSYSLLKTLHLFLQWRHTLTFRAGEVWLLLWSVCKRIAFAAAHHMAALHFHVSV
ncbi:hypothetical protein GDO78_018321 [Eleutherodactylus coqui]|uniref:Uncharacterized protein n=1 Tax=Eleutherodactylus coqui TaxID=57060 RepID=A0A8J6E5U6_ELECQ|nr:hypothetical protein GDO78_018321 [Eleutherodactylus coqui]